ncbi:MAG: DUF4177 domain-containing protein [Actinobacteria bacterium]|nr:DUF4177 domain-containing protein [Actinomycetota bacterium]
MPEQSDTLKWEYSQVSVRSSSWSFRAKNRDKAVTELNELGREGWELAGSYLDLGYTQYYILKRSAREIG